MTPSSTSRALLAGVLLVAGFVVVGMGCAASPAPRTEQPAPQPERVAPQAPAPAPEPEIPPPAPEPQAKVAQAPDPTDDLTVVIDPGYEMPGGGPSLAEASRAEKERRRSTGRATVVITNSNLDEFQEGQITEMAVVHGPTEPAEAGDPQAGDDLLLYQEEQYWREQALGTRLRWRDALDQIARLEETTAALRRRFYSEDDPFYRDSQIKPEWDRSLDLLGQARRQAEDSSIEIRELMERGRRAGALPGWLREGIEFEPQPERNDEDEEDDFGFYEPEDPTEYDPDNDGGN